MSAEAERLARVTRERCATIPLPVEWSHPFFRSPLADAVVSIDNLLAELARLHGSRDADYAARDQDMFLALKADLARLRAAMAALYSVWDQPMTDKSAAQFAIMFEGYRALLAPPVPTIVLREDEWDGR